MRMRANEALNPVAEHDSMHISDFHATAIVIKRDVHGSCICSLMTTV